MSESQEKRGRGRPRLRGDEETRTVILDAANAAFRLGGYAAASMFEIARIAGVSTKTLYKLFPTKEALFSSVLASRIEGFVLAVEPDGLRGVPVEQALEGILTAYGELALSPDVVMVTRLVVSESGRFPELAAAFQDHAVSKIGAVMEEWLASPSVAAQLDIEDAALASAMLRGMMAFEPQRAAMTRQAPVPTSEEIRRRAKICSRIFVSGVARQRRVERD